MSQPGHKSRGDSGSTLTAEDGESGLRRAIGEKPDLILLDIMMPKLDGYAVCAELRRLANPVPILMLTAKGQVEDRVAGLDVGADDYLVKPFSTDELLARVRALLRRTHRQTHTTSKLKLGDVEIDQCVSSTVRSLADESFNVVVLEDCCAAGSDELHHKELEVINMIYCHVMSSAELCQMMGLAKA